MGEGEVMRDIGEGRGEREGERGKVREGRGNGDIGEVWGEEGGRTGDWGWGEEWGWKGKRKGGEHKHKYTNKLIKTHRRKPGINFPKLPEIRKMCRTPPTSPPSPRAEVTRQGVTSSRRRTEPPSLANGDTFIGGALKLLHFPKHSITI